MRNSNDYYDLIHYLGRESESPLGLDSGTGTSAPGCSVCIIANILNRQLSKDTADNNRTGHKNNYKSSRSRFRRPI